jgi:D-sedoheptulose 7-phosphate isomerase
VQCSDASAAPLPVGEAFKRTAQLVARCDLGSTHKIMIIGNGGSAGIASHMAIDFAKNGGLRTLAFNDGAALTCLANDLGFDQVFERQVDMHAYVDDVLIAISSSGRSENILRAVQKAHSQGCDVITYSGFSPENPLRRLGSVNFFLSSSEYGFVEVGHLALIHCVLDLLMRGAWTGNDLGSVMDEVVAA